MSRIELNEDELTTLCCIRDLVRWGASRFNEAGLYYGHGTDNALDDAAQLVLHTLHLDPFVTGHWLDAVVTAAERDQVLKLISERIKTRKPTAYITGEAWFAGLPFHVDERVLVPRSPIAELIEQGFVPWFDENAPSHILDLGTGSGCIGIACAMRFPGVAVDLVDISADALAVATSNVARHHLEPQVECIESDGLNGVQGRHYDLIISNPPYVSETEYQALPAEYHEEPSVALVSDDDGLAFTLRLLRDAPAVLTEEGVLIVELGNTAAELDERYPEIPVTWLEFERGGFGVFAIDRRSLEAWLDTIEPGHDA